MGPVSFMLDGKEGAMDAFRIIVADDHPIVRFGVCALLQSRAGWEVCGEASDGREAVTKCKALKPDLVILDICMPKLNGVDAACQIMKDNPKQSILVLTNVDSDQVIRNCLQAGVRGWVSKSDGVEELTAAVEEMQRKATSFSPRVSDLIMDGYLQRNHVAERHELTTLSSRQREVVQLLAEGKSTKEVAAILHMAVKTAETHRSNIMRKLNLHSIAQVVLYAVRNEIVHVQLPQVFRIPLSRIGEPTHVLTA